MSVTAVPLRPLSKGTLPKLWIGVALLLAGAVAFAWCTTSSRALSSISPSAFLDYNGSRSGVVTTGSGMQYEILEEGDGGESPTPSDTVLVNYSVRAPGGEIVDDGQNTPLPLAGSFPGFAEGVQQMTRGARYKLWLPPRLWLPPSISPGDPAPEGSPFQTTDVLEFEVELLDFFSTAEMMEMQQQMQEQAEGADGQ